MSLSVSLDKASYNQGDKVTLTVTRVGTGPTPPQNFTGTATGSVSGPVSFQLTVNGKPGETLTVSDSGNHTWTLFSDDGTTAVYTTTA